MVSEISLHIIQNIPARYNITLSMEALDIQNVYNEYYAKIGFILPWVGYFISVNDLIVGVCGFKGQPINGEVEIAYYTFEQYQNQGIASLACKKLIAMVRDYDESIQILANTSPEYNYSTNILQRNNFMFIREYEHELDGKIWEWKLR